MLINTDLITPKKKLYELTGYDFVKWQLSLTKRGCTTKI